MKKLFALLMLFLALPSLTAFASSDMCTSKSFTIRNWKGEVETPVDDEITLLGEEAEPPASTIPVSTMPPAPTSTDVVETEEQGEQEEQGEPEGEEQKQPSEVEPSEPEEPSEVEPEGEQIEQAVFFGDDLNAHEVEQGEQSGEVETEEQGETEEQFIS